MFSNYSTARIIQSLISIVLFSLFLIAAVMIIAGIVGIVIKSIKKSPTERWVRYVKEGAVILIISIVLYFISTQVFAFLGLSIGSSFTGDTLVWTSNGKVKISELDIGDEVKGYNLETNTIVDEKIEQCRDYKVNSYYLINGTLKATSEHPFAVRQSGNTVWKKVNELAVGDELVGAQPLVPLVVKSIEEISSNNQITVYNPQVSGNSNYFVFIGNNAALVHNKSRLPALKEPERCDRKGS
jgi:hypothetical protein